MAHEQKDFEKHADGGVRILHRRKYQIDFTKETYANVSASIEKSAITWEKYLDNVVRNWKGVPHYYNQFDHKIQEVKDEQEAKHPLA